MLIETQRLLLRPIELGDLDQFLLRLGPPFNDLKGEPLMHIIASFALSLSHD